MDIAGIPVRTNWFIDRGTIIRTPDGIVMHPVNFVQVTHRGEDPYRVLLDQLRERVTKRAAAHAQEATDRIEAMYR